MQEIIVYAIVGLAIWVVFKRYVLQIGRSARDAMAESSEKKSRTNVCENCSGCSSSSNETESRIIIVKKDDK